MQSKQQMSQNKTPIEKRQTLEIDFNKKTVFQCHTKINIPSEKN